MSRHGISGEKTAERTPQETLSEFEDLYPAFTGVLAKYYPDDELRFFTDYTRKGGEQAVEFNGLNDELKKLVKSPKEADALINGYFELELPRAEVRSIIVDFFDRLNGTGDYDAALQARETQERAKSDPNYLFDSYANQYFTLPKWVPGKFPALPKWFGSRLASLAGKPVAGTAVPLWLAFITGMAIAGGFGALGALVALPAWIAWLPLLLTLLGLAIALASAWAMQSKRKDVLHPKTPDDDDSETDPKKRRKRRRVERFID